MSGQERQSKPTFRIPSMQEISAIPLNGRNVISTFSGCGGSSLGYRMAGFKVLMANEFIKAAQQSYKANFPDTIIDERDIRSIKAKEIFEKVNIKKGDLDILDGSPPCASFSTAGKREASWNKIKKYSDTEQRTDDLFFEYARLLEELQPKVFIAENVSGLVKGVAKGYFKIILEKLKHCGYRVRAKVINAKWLGVPQDRRRTIFIGVRADIGLDPVFPTPLPYFYTIKDAIPWVNKARFGRAGWKTTDRVSPTVSASLAYNPETSGQGMELIEAELDISKYAIGKEWDNMGYNSKSQKYFSLIRPSINNSCPTITATGGVLGAASVTHPFERRKLSILEVKRICAFPDDFILKGTFQQQWERLGRSVPPVMMCAIATRIYEEILCKIE